MQDYDLLRERVEKVMRKLGEAHSQRSHFDLSVIDTLRRVGGKIATQQSLLKDYRAQIGALKEEKAHPTPVANAHVRQPLEANDLGASLETATTDKNWNLDDTFQFPWETSPDEP